MNTPLYVDIHALQTVPYANLNRDDLGAPKTLIYGGTERTRVSSQSWKRVVRHEIERRLGDPALRTRRIVQSVSALLVQQGWDPDLAIAGARQVILSAGKSGIKFDTPPKDKPDQNITSVTLYLPVSAIRELAAIAAEHQAAVAAEAAKAKKEPNGILPHERIADVLRSRNGTIQLMGRMLAELPGAEVDGAVQFAHAFTTHSTQVETDFFTAVDDIEKEGDFGSAHMNAAQFSAGTFYRYANVGLGTLLANLDGDLDTAGELTAEFLRAFAKTVPSGKQNATAAMTIPDLVYIAIRADRPVSFAPAFEDPVRSELGFGAPSRDAFAAYATQLSHYWGTADLIRHGHASIWGKPLTGLGEQAASIDELLAASAAAAFPRPGQS
jgi:CRISPR system Cascade subunit CasC